MPRRTYVLEDNYGSRFSPSTVFILGIQLKLQGWCQVPVPYEPFSGMFLIVGRSFCEHLAFYLEAQAKSRVHTRALGNTRTELHPIRCIPHMHCYGTMECVHNLNNSRKGLLCILRVHTKAMTFLSI